MNMIHKLIEEDIRRHLHLKEMYEEQDEILELAIKAVKLRDKLEWSQTKLANVLGTTQSIISSIEQGDYPKDNSVINEIYHFYQNGQPYDEKKLIFVTHEAIVIYNNND